MSGTPHQPEHALISPPSHSQLDALFIVDVEATSPTPMTGVMTEFAVVHVHSGRSFYGHLYRNHPHPDIPALPVADEDEDGYLIPEPFWITDGKNLEQKVDGLDVEDVARDLQRWLADFRLTRRVLVSDNNGFDAMWLNCFTDPSIGELLFGHSSRRIGDFAAGVRGQWEAQSSWKQLRRTAHSHHPLDDAHGNAEALRVLLGVDTGWKLTR
ncbi:hypothetical protein [Tsukamurella tyrosinosolvens]|uniref:hypothetical protein n=1 Tax=Tsukamurella tyrosinosolvens TaxID=57704 RepID=UPI0009433E72|nr:hypothetical protein [Tsukamurella tyrosinosolvens]